MEAVINQARQNLKARLPMVLERLADEAEQGHHQHIKIMLDHLDKLEERQQQAEMGTISFTWRVPVQGPLEGPPHDPLYVETPAAQGPSYPPADLIEVTSPMNLKRPEPREPEPATPNTKEEPDGRP
jgi:hypothetical protein